jgi:uncharacterized Zn finger protein (UPF0148 family)
MQQPDDPRTQTYQGECPICGYVLDGHQCNMICPNCGYREDCSDTFRTGPVEPPPEDQAPNPSPPNEPQ